MLVEPPRGAAAFEMTRCFMVEVDVGSPAQLPSDLLSRMSLTACDAPGPPSPRPSPARALFRATPRGAPSAAAPPQTGPSSVPRGPHRPFSGRRRATVFPLRSHGRSWMCRPSSRARPQARLEPPYPQVQASPAAADSLRQGPGRATRLPCARSAGAPRSETTKPVETVQIRETYTASFPRPVP